MTVDGEPLNTPSAPETLPGAGMPLEPIAPAPVNEVPAAPNTPAAAPVEPPAASPAATDAHSEPTLFEKVLAEKDAKVVDQGQVPEKPKEQPVKPGEIPKVVDSAAPTEVKPAAPVEPAVLPPFEPAVYSELKLPDGFEADGEKMGVLSTILGENRVGAEVGQKLLDLHAQTMQDYAAKYAQSESARQHQVWADTRKGWQQQVKGDEQLGGAGHQTAMGAVARMRDLVVPEKHREAFNEMLRVTGVGDHPEFLRAFHNIARLLDEPAMPPANPQPPPNNGKNPRSRGMAAIYDNPSSPHNR